MDAHRAGPFTGANTEGVRNPFAVLTARLSPAELPAPTGQRPARPPWCGECDQATRMLGFGGAAPVSVSVLQANHHSQLRESCYAVRLRPWRLI